MNYEIHITLEVSNTDTFIKHCREIGVKPIVIETENRKEEHSLQVMTSSTHEGKDYNIILNNICSELIKRKYKILRKKVEIQPDEKKHISHVYYETHLRLKLEHDFDFNSLKEKCVENKFHLSKNLFKKEKDFVYQMITFRGSHLPIDRLYLIINRMARELDILNIEYDKIEIEECIFDSNSGIDYTWLN